MNEENLKKIQQRARQYWFVDGLAELFTGGACLFLAIYFWLYQFEPISGWLSLLVMVGILCVGFAMRWIMQQIKARTTYPRTGYVEPQSFWEQKGLAGALLAFTILLNAFMVITSLKFPLSPIWTPLIGAVIFAAIFAAISYQARLLRFAYLASFCLVTGGVMAFCGFGDWPATALLSALTGLILLVFGFLTRRAYQQQNPGLPS